MDTGVAIIVGSIVIAGSILYASMTKMTIIRRDAAFFFAGIVTVAFAVAAIYYYQEKVGNRPQSQTSFIEVPLQARTDEVIFLKGQPPEKLSNVCWKYYIEGPFRGEGRPSYLIVFENDRTVSIVYSASKPEIFDRSILGFGLGADYEHVVDTLQSKSVIRNSPDGLERIVAYPDLQAFYRFRTGRVVGFGIFSASSKEPRFESCLLAKAE